MVSTYQAVESLHSSDESMSSGQLPILRWIMPKAPILEPALLVWKNFLMRRGTSRRSHEAHRVRNILADDFLVK
jgi:hypothetical protein